MMSPENDGQGNGAFHWRMTEAHTHAGWLIARGVDIVTISKRLGHAKPSVTLAIYAHMFTTDDRQGRCRPSMRP
jgi:hypothetical protein